MCLNNKRTATEIRIRCPRVASTLAPPPPLLLLLPALHSPVRPRDKERNKKSELKQRRQLSYAPQPEVRPSPFLCLDANKFVLLREFQLNHCSMMQKVHFLLMSVVQKHCCLSSLLFYSVFSYRSVPFVA